MARVYWRARRGQEKAKKEAPANGSWWADYRGPLGDRRQERLPTARTKGEAEVLLRQISERAFRVGRGLEIDAGPVTFGEAARRYIESTQHLASHDRVEGDLRIHVLPMLQRKVLGEITPADVERCIQARRSAGVAETTLKRIEVRIGAVFRWSIRRARIFAGPSPMESVTRVRPPVHAPRYFTPEQLARLIDHAEPETRIVVLTAALTGMRKGELAGLRWTDVDLVGGMISVRRSFGRDTTKSGRERQVPIAAPLLRELKEWRLKTPGELVFPRPGTDRMRGGTWHVLGFRSAMRRAGLDRTGLLFRHLRSTFATHLAASSGDLRLVQVLLGHSSPAITARAYAHAHLDYLRQGIAAHPLRDVGGTRAPESLTPQPHPAKEGSTK